MQGSGQAVGCQKDVGSMPGGCCEESCKDVAAVLRKMQSTLDLASLKGSLAAGARQIALDRLWAVRPATPPESAATKAQHTHTHRDMCLAVAF